MSRLLLGLVLVAATSVARAAHRTSEITYGQTLIEKFAHANPAVLGAAIQLTPPNGADNVIVASTELREVGMRSDATDLAVLHSGKTNVRVDEADHRIEVRVPLLDVSKNSIGTLTVVIRKIAALAF